MTASTRPAPTVGTRWTPAATAWFAAMVVAWIAFFTVLAFDAPALGDLWRDVRGLPLLLEGAVWFALFPLVLALAVWDAGWPEWIRLAAVSTFAVVWSAAFFPRRKHP